MKRYLIQFQLEDEAPDTTHILVEKHQKVESELKKKIIKVLKHQGLTKEEAKEHADTVQILEMKETK